jgi:ferredoxin
MAAFGCLAALAGCSKNQATANTMLTVEASLCKGCGQCAAVCKGDAITVMDNKATIDPARCIRCGNCVKVCPYDAIY